MWGDRTVGLDFDEEVGVERVGDFVAGEEYVRHGEKLPRDGASVYDTAASVGKVKYSRAEQIGERVILLHDLNRSSVGDLGVFDDFKPELG